MALVLFTQYYENKSLCRILLHVIIMDKKLQEILFIYIEI